MSENNLQPKSFFNNIALHITILVIFGTIIWFLYYSLKFQGQVYGDALDYAGIARNLYRGQGFASDEIMPLQLAFKEGLPQPNLWRTPLHILAIAAAFFFFGLSNRSIALASTFFFFLAIPAVYLSIKRLFSPKIAFLGTLIFVSSPYVLYYSVSGLTESMALFWMTLWLLVLLLDKEQRKWLYYIAGGLAGLLYLTRYNAILFLFPALVYIFLTQKNGRFSCLVRFLSSFAIVVSPWLWRNYILIGNPFFSLQKFEVAMFTRAYPGYSLYMIPEAISIFDFVLSHLRDMGIKIIQGFGTFYITLPTADFSGIGEFLMVFFIASIFYWFDPKQERFRWLVYSMILLQMFALAFIHHLARLFFIFAPFFIAYGVAFFVHLIDKLKISAFNRNLIYVLATIFFILPPFVRVINPFRQHLNTKPYAQEQIREIKNASSRKGVIATDIPDEVSWHADRVSVSIPVKPQMMGKIEERLPVQAVFLSSMLNEWVEVDKSWLKIYAQKPKRFREYTLRERFPNGSLLYVKEKSNKSR